MRRASLALVLVIPFLVGCPYAAVVGDNSAEVVRNTQENLQDFGDAIFTRADVHAVSGNPISVAIPGRWRCFVEVTTMRWSSPRT